MESRRDPYDYQPLAIDHASAWLDSASPGDRRLYAAPTGTGKSYIETALLQRFPDAWLVTPRLEIVAGLLDKLGVAVDGDLIDVALEHRITTPIRFRNALARCEQQRPAKLIIDECHHAEATTYKELDILASGCPAVGFTATPYRGTPAGTKALLDAWGDPVWILTYPEAAARGVLSVPTCRVVPLVDDDVITVSKGEFVITAANAAISSRLEAVTELCRNAGNRPTMVAVPSREIAYLLHSTLLGASVPSAIVTGDTSRADRERAFQQCVDRQAVLVQINVVSEGIDLPIRRLIDLRPTLSPVYWLQLVGRITRPVREGEAAPEYMCCCRNLERHCYLFQGLVPLTEIRQAQQAFSTPSKRSGARALGLEAVGRFKATELPLVDGSTGQLYCIQVVEGTQVRQYAVLVHPAAAEPLCATRINQRVSTGTRWGRWEQCPVPTITNGFASVTAGQPSEKQLAWWTRSAKRYGLDSTATVTRRQFAALPVLADLGLKLECA